MQVTITTPAAVLVVSSYEFVRAGIVAALLKMESTLVDSITEQESVEEAIETCSRKHFPLIIIDESILKKGDLHAVKRLMKMTSHSIVLCQLFKEDIDSRNLLKHCGLSGFFYRSIDAEVFREELKKLLKGQEMSGEGIFVIN